MEMDDDESRAAEEPTDERVVSRCRGMQYDGGAFLSAWHAIPGLCMTCAKVALARLPILFFDLPHALCPS